MTVGEESQFLISYRALFGAMGCPPRIKPKADALYIITVLEATNIGDDQALESISNEDKNKFSVVKTKVYILMNSAREKYKTGRTNDAIRSWRKAVEVLQFCQLKDMTEQAEQTALLETLFTNLAVSYNKEDRPLQTLSIINDLRRIADVNQMCKVLFQEGRALIKIGEYDKAKTKLAKALNLQPLNKEVVKELELLEKRMIKSSREEKEMAQRALNFKPLPKVIEVKEIEKVSEDFKIEIKKQVLVFVNDENALKLKLIDNLSSAEMMFIENLAQEYKLIKHHTLIGDVKTYYLQK